VAVTIDLGRFWELWKVPLYFWRWSHSPQLEVALCVAAYVGVLLVEMSPAAFETWRSSGSSGLRSFSEGGLKLVNGALPWIVALGLLLPTMHQSSLGTMMLLPGPRVHPLWFTPWLPLLFLVNCIAIGYAVVVLEATFSSIAFKRERHSDMLTSLSKVAAWVTLGWTVFRVVEVAIAGDLRHLASLEGAAFLGEIALNVLALAILFNGALRSRPAWQVRAAILMLLAGALFRINTYLVAFSPGEHFTYFPAFTEILITLGIIALEILIYIAAVRFFPILSGAPAHATTHR
jgi:Ni/Fe-hydrogenase subunit HybB-like protein